MNNQSYKVIDEKWTGALCSVFFCKSYPTREEAIEKAKELFSKSVQHIVSVVKSIYGVEDVVWQNEMEF